MYLEAATKDEALIVRDTIDAALGHPTKGVNMASADAALSEPSLTRKPVKS